MSLHVGARPFVLELILLHPPTDLGARSLGCAHTKWGSRSWVSIPSWGNLGSETRIRARRGVRSPEKGGFNTLRSRPNPAFGCALGMRTPKPLRAPPTCGPFLWASHVVGECMWLPVSSLCMHLYAWCAETISAVCEKLGSITCAMGQWEMMVLLKTGCCEIIFTIARFKFSKSLYFEAMWEKGFFIFISTGQKRRVNFLIAFQKELLFIICRCRENPQILNQVDSIYNVLHLSLGNILWICRDGFI